MSGPLLKVEDIDLFYGDAQALAGVSLEIAQGEIVAIVGANGAGKSSLIRSIHGIEKPARVQRNMATLRNTSKCLLNSPSPKLLRMEIRSQGVTDTGAKLEMKFSLKHLP